MIRLDLIDERRKREIPVAIYDAGSGARGLILFSVGFGGGREGYSSLGRAWSEAGFRTFIVEHVGSNLQVLKSIQRPGQRYADLAVKVGQKAHSKGRTEKRTDDE